MSWSSEARSGGAFLADGFEGGWSSVFGSSSEESLLSDRAEIANALSIARAPFVGESVIAFLERSGAIFRGFSATAGRVRLGGTFLGFA